MEPKSIEELIREVRLILEAVEGCMQLSISEPDKKKANRITEDGQRHLWKSLHKLAQLFGRIERGDLPMRIPPVLDKLQEEYELARMKEDQASGRKFRRH